LRVATLPPGARLLLDDSDVGFAPANLTRLTAGSYTVAASLQGFHIGNEQVELAPLS